MTRTEFGTALAGCIISAGILVGCLVAGPPLPPIPPTYGPDCTPTHDRYLVLARDVQDRLTPDELLEDPAAMLGYCKAQATSRGFVIVKKAAKDPTAGWSTTVANVMALSHDFDEKPIESQAATACHELVHVKQEVRLGIGFGILWATSHGRFALEVPAFAEGAAVHAAFGKSWAPSVEVEEAGELADRVFAVHAADAARFVDFYRLADLPLSTFPRECAIQWARSIWAEGR